jgi:5-methyltetrahydrofolate--homocysteine methyltransferase
MMSIMDEIKRAIIEGEDEAALALVKDALNAGESAHTILQEALMQAMNEIGYLWNKGDAFLPEVMGAAQIFQKAADYLEPSLIADGHKEQLGTVVIGTVYGDLHNLGKNLVAVMLRTAGFNVVDLGINVSSEAFIGAARKHHARIIGLSALLTTTMVEQKLLIENLIEAGCRKEFKVIVGGAPISQKWADDIGADGYARNAGEAVVLATKLLKL